MRKIASMIVAIVLVFSMGTASAINEDRFMNSPGNQKMAGAIVYGLMDVAMAQDPGGLMVMLYSTVKLADKEIPVLDVMFGAKTFVATLLNVETDTHTYVVPIGDLSNLGIKKVDEMCNILTTRETADMFRDMSTSKKVKLILIGGTNKNNKYNFTLTDKQKVQLGLVADEYDEEIAKYYEPEGSEYDPVFAKLIDTAKCNVAVGNK